MIKKVVVMTDKEKLDKFVAEIERRKKEVKDNISELGNSESERIGLFDKEEIYNDILSFYNSMQEEPVSDDLEGEINRYLSTWSTSKDNGIVFCEKMARHFAAWQKQQMMANAVDATVHSDAGGYPYIPQMELYDYEKDIPLAEEGEKVKVIVIKEG